MHVLDDVARNLHNKIYNLIKNYDPEVRNIIKDILIPYCEDNRGDCAFISKHEIYIRKVLKNDCKLEEHSNLLNLLITLLNNSKASDFKRSAPPLLDIICWDSRFDFSLDILRKYKDSFYYIEGVWQDFNFAMNNYTKEEIEQVLTDAVQLENKEFNAHLWHEGFDLMELFTKLNDHVLKLKEENKKEENLKTEFTSIRNLLQAAKNQTYRDKKEHYSQYENLNESQKLEQDWNDLNSLARYFAEQECGYCKSLAEYTEKLNDCTLTLDVSEKMFKDYIKVQKTFEMKYKLLDDIVKNNSKNIREVCKKYNLVGFQFPKISFYVIPTEELKGEIESAISIFDGKLSDAQHENALKFLEEQKERRKKAGQNIINGDPVKINNGRGEEITKNPSFVRINARGDDTRFLILKKELENLPFYLEDCKDLDETYKNLIQKDGKISSYFSELRYLPGDKRSEFGELINSTKNKLTTIYNNKKSKETEKSYSKEELDK